MSKKKLLPMKAKAVKVWVYPGHLKESFFNVYNHTFSRSVRSPFYLIPLSNYRAMKREVKQKDRVLRAVIRSAYLYQLGKLPAREDQIQLGRDLAIYGTLPVKPKKANPISPP